jgi:phosphate uptake regulator
MRRVGRYERFYTGTMACGSPDDEAPDGKELGMAREQFDQELRELQDDVLRLGSMVEKMVIRAVAALKERDVTLAQQVIADDSQVDALAYATEDKAMALISMQQPVARDLRRIASALVIVQELERMGDHAEGIAKLSRKLSKEPPIKPLIDIPRMADHATEIRPTSRVIRRWRPASGRWMTSSTTSTTRSTASCLPS